MSADEVDALVELLGVKENEGEVVELTKQLVDLVWAHSNGVSITAMAAALVMFAEGRADAAISGEWILRTAVRLMRRLKGDEEEP